MSQCNEYSSFANVNHIYNREMCFPCNSQSNHFLFAMVWNPPFSEGQLRKEPQRLIEASMILKTDSVFELLNH